MAFIPVNPGWVTDSKLCFDQQGRLYYHSTTDSYIDKVKKNLPFNWQEIDYNILCKIIVQQLSDQLAQKWDMPKDNYSVVLSKKTINKHKQMAKLLANEAVYKVQEKQLQQQKALAKTVSNLVLEYWRNKQIQKQKLDKLDKYEQEFFKKQSHKVQHQSNHKFTRYKRKHQTRKSKKKMSRQLFKHRKQLRQEEYAHTELIEQEEYELEQHYQYLMSIHDFWDYYYPLDDWKPWEL